MSPAPVRVAVDAGPLYGVRTGIGNAVAELVGALSTRSDIDVEPYLVSSRARPADGARRFPLPAAAALRWWASGRFDRVAAATFDRWSGDVDVVHGTNYVVPPSRHPRVVSVYDVWFWKQPGLVGADVNRRGRALARAIDEGVTVHTSSQATAAAVRDRHPTARVATIHLGPLPLAQPAVRPPIDRLRDVPFVLATGTLEQRKNLPRLVAAFGRLRAGGHSDLQLVIAGPDGDDRRAVDDAILALPRGLEERVHLAGYVSGPARSWLLHHAAVLAYPSLDEGFGFPLLDAMQAGTPVVAADAGSIPEVAGDAALLVDPLDIDAIAGGIEDALSTATADRLRRAGQARVREFSWTTTAARFADLYRQLAEEGRR